MKYDVRPSRSSANSYAPLPRSFYARDTHEVARELLGKLLVRRWRGTRLVGRITETESYVGPDDLACHARRGRTKRTEVMFGPAGNAYVYLVYGMYDLLNIVTEEEGFPAAVLIRSLQPLEGIESMQRARKVTNLKQITTGPGKLTQAMRITRAQNFVDMTTTKQLWIADDGFAVREEQVTAGPRIGVDYAQHCAAYPWRYYLNDSAFVSRT